MWDSTGPKGGSGVEIPARLRFGNCGFRRRGRQIRWGAVSILCRSRRSPRRTARSTARTRMRCGPSIPKTPKRTGRASPFPPRGDVAALPGSPPRSTTATSRRRLIHRPVASRSRRRARPRLFPWRRCADCASEVSTGTPRRPPGPPSRHSASPPLSTSTRPISTCARGALLIPTHPPCIELLGRDGSPGEAVEVDREAAARILSQAAAHAAEGGIGWETDEVRLVPAPKLVELIRRSRKLSAKPSSPRSE